MVKSNDNVDINELLINVHKLSVKRAIDVAARTNTRLVVCIDGKIVKIKPDYKYVRVPITSKRRSKSPRVLASKKKKS